MSDGMGGTRAGEAGEAGVADDGQGGGEGTAAPVQAPSSRPCCRLLHPGNYPDFSVLPWANLLNHTAQVHQAHQSQELRGIKMLTVQECKTIIRRHLVGRQGRCCTLQDILDENPDGEIGLFLLAAIEMASEDELEITQNNDKHTGDARTITLRIKTDA